MAGCQRMKTTYLVTAARSSAVASTSHLKTKHTLWASTSIVAHFESYGASIANCLIVFGTDRIMMRSRNKTGHGQLCPILGQSRLLACRKASKSSWHEPC